MRKGCLLSSATAVLWVSTGCQLFDPGYRAKTSEIHEIRLVADSERVQGLISRQDAHSVGERASVDRFLKDEARLVQQNRQPELDQLLKHPEIYMPGRIAFLDAMAQEPTAAVAPGSFCRILQRSSAVCSRHPQENPYFIKVRVTSGMNKGVEGWGCLGNGIGLTVAWP
jgi:hypothetical protein